MYARRFQVHIVTAGRRRSCPLDWLDQFAMRNFTGSAEFDDMLPLADGLVEAGFRVEPARLSAALADWLNRRGKGAGQQLAVEIRELPRDHSSTAASPR